MTSVIYCTRAHAIREYNRLNGISGTKVKPYVAKRSRGGDSHNSRRLQKEFINGAVDILGDDAWRYALKRGGEVRKLKDTWHTVKTNVGYSKLPYSTFYKWFIHYLQFGETKVDTSRRKLRLKLRRNRRGKRWYTKASTFSAAEERGLKQIFEKSPQLYLDEIQMKMIKKFGKKWHTSTLWRRMHRLQFAESCVPCATEERALAATIPTKT